nr:WD repeat-containing protein 7-like [Penaeus vannamei]
MEGIGSLGFLVVLLLIVYDHISLFCALCNPSNLWFSHLNHSMMTAWAAMMPPPIGVLDQLEGEKNPPRITASLFLPLQGRLACGREDGSIILVPATETIMLHLLHGKHQHYHNWAQPMVLRGHQGRVNCLLYPHGESSRYDMAHLVSGGIDFSINVWDMYTGNLVHRFVVQAGQILQLLVPPPTCTPRIQNCICSISEDHSVALLSIKERKLVLLASKHLYPVLTVKWRPEHDFLMVATQDGSVYVWQMETDDRSLPLAQESADADHIGLCRCTQEETCGWLVTQKQGFEKMVTQIPMLLSDLQELSLLAARYHKRQLKLVLKFGDHEAGIFNRQNQHEYYKS